MPEYLICDVCGCERTSVKALTQHRRLAHPEASKEAEDD